MPISTTPGRPATAGSTSRGIARSRTTSGPGRPARARAVIAADTMSPVMTCPAAPVQETNDVRGAPWRSGRSASPASRWRSRPRRGARRDSRVRLATTMLAAPLLAAVAAASALIEPAPTMSTSRPASASGPGRAAEAGRGQLDRHGEQAEAGRSIPVSARARLPVRSASRPSSPRTRPTVPCSPAKLAPSGPGRGSGPRRPPSSQARRPPRSGGSPHVPRSARTGTG